MNEKISKTNEKFAFFNARLDEVRMSGHERLIAKARFAQAEAIANLAFALVDCARGLLKPRATRPLHRPTTSTG